MKILRTKRRAHCLFSIRRRHCDAVTGIEEITRNVRKNKRTMNLRSAAILATYTTFAISQTVSEFCDGSSDGDGFCSLATSSHQPGV